MKKLTSFLLALALAYPLAIPSVRALSVTQITCRPIAGDHSILAASYGENHQMLFLTQLDGQSPSHQVPTGAAYTKLFWTKDGAPLCGSAVIAPGAEVSAAMLLTLVGQTAFPDAEPSGVWYEPYMQAAQKAGWLSGTGLSASAPFAAVSRYDMAAVLDAAAAALNIPAQDSASAEIRDYDSIPENYRGAVGRVYSLGLVQLDGTGNFNGGAAMTCADALVIQEVLPRLKPLDQELRSACDLGLFPAGWAEKQDENISFSGYQELLDRLVLLCDPSAQSRWETAIDPSKFPSRAPLRSDGLVMLMLAGDALGYTIYNARDYGFCTEKRMDREGKYDLMFSQCGGDFPYCNPRTITLYFQENDPDEDAIFDNPWSAAPFWMQRRMDLFQRLHFFDHDGSLDFHLDQPLTYGDAARAALRLYQSEALEYDPTRITRVPTELDREILEKAESRKTAILENADSLPCTTGTAYYVSNDGDDANDGLTPETAWATLDKVNHANLSPGDGVYFRRGDLWRGQLWAQERVIYSAYGTGEKPRFYASTENGAGAEKWSLLEGTDNIWVYHKDLMDCGNLVFDEGERWGKKIFPHYLDGYRSTTDPGQPFDVRRELTEDLAFFSEADSILYDGAPFRYTVMDNCDRNEVPEVVGSLYLRCDQGNPGEVFDSIEFMERQNLIVPADRAVFHNLCLKYCGAHAIWSGDMGYDVSFCEIGWIGGCIQYYSYGDGSPVRFGNGVECDGSYSGYSVEDSYIYQCFDAGVSNQDPSESSDITGSEVTYRDVIQKDITYARNVIAYTPMAVEIFFTLEDGTGGTRHYMENVQIADNLILYTGYGWAADRTEPWAIACYQTHSTPNTATNFRIENNVFYLSAGSLFNMRTDSQWRPEFDGNTYVQNPHSVLMIDIGEGSSQQFFFDETASAAVRDVLGDSTAILAD